MIVSLIPNVLDSLRSGSEHRNECADLREWKPLEWAVPAQDPDDDPHMISIGYWLGAVRADGSPQPELQLRLSADAGILTPNEARAIAASLITAAAYADGCTIVED